MAEERILSSTRVDAHGEKMTRGALISAARQMLSHHASGLGVDHDITLPPMGKWNHARVVPDGKGEYILLGTQEFAEVVGEVVLPDGTSAIHESCPTDKRPFITDAKSTAKTTVDFDYQNFSDAGKLEFQETIRRHKGVRQERLLRKSVIAPPELVIHVANDVVMYLLGKKVLDKTISTIGTDVDKFYAFLRDTVVNYAKNALPKNHPKTYALILSGEPAVEFVARSKDADAVIRSMQKENLKSSIEMLDTLREQFNAVKVQFLLNSELEWKINYLLTDKGDVIGDRKNIKLRNDTVRFMEILNNYK